MPSVPYAEQSSSLAAASSGTVQPSAHATSSPVAKRRKLRITQPRPDTWWPSAREPSIAAPVSRPMAPSRIHSPIRVTWCTSHQAVPHANAAPRSSHVATIASASASLAAIGFSQEIPLTPASAHAITASRAAFTGRMLATTSGTCHARSSSTVSNCRGIP